ncbi:hypothetical protein LPJ09_27150, partial [Klebsiella pneumoniae]|nr:hypothetical protein [Klebsiella pneumoniae]
KRAYCLKTQPATGETYPKSDLFNKALSNPKARVEMGIKGRKRIQDKFSSGMIISKTLKTYHDVVEG